MADAIPTSKTRLCEACGSTYQLNPNYSKAQVERSRYCSRSCAGKLSSRPRVKLSIAELLAGRLRFGRLTVVGEGKSISGGDHLLRRARCICDCGNIRDIQPGKLKQGQHLSCGCLAAEMSKNRFTKHGGYDTREYISWSGMMQRCHNPDSTSWERYGGRGITVCPEWHGPEGFHRFVEHVGPRPAGKTIDRIDGTKGYAPGNVRWATPKEQSANISTNRMMTLDGVTKIASAWADDLDIPRTTFFQRLSNGWSDERALTEPLNTANSHPRR